MKKAKQLAEKIRKSQSDLKAKLFPDPIEELIQELLKPIESEPEKQKK